ANFCHSSARQECGWGSASSGVIYVASDDEAGDPAGSDDRGVQDGYDHRWISAVPAAGLLMPAVTGPAAALTVASKGHAP
ncbi:hypothetical protein, partial [Nitrospirillum viridazoti]|uniref:hypothetical protein n=1 Tax=Nitrospirillum viridazoti TaxID=3144925 RepID=UPI0019D6C3E1